MRGERYWHVAQTHGRHTNISHLQTVYKEILFHQTGRQISGSTIECFDREKQRKMPRKSREKCYARN